MDSILLLLSKMCYERFQGKIETNIPLYMMFKISCSGIFLKNSVSYCFSQHSEMAWSSEFSWSEQGREREM